MKWTLRLYDKNDIIIESINIIDRNEKEAEKESQYYINTCEKEVFDWTLNKG